MHGLRAYFFACDTPSKQRSNLRMLRRCQCEERRYDCHRQYEIAGQKRGSDSRCAGSVRQYCEVLSAQASGYGMHPFLPAVRETGHAGRGAQGKEVLL